jgi:hypothetical protein
MLPAYRLKLYRNFKALDAHDFHGIVRYYERFEDGLRTLDFEEYVDCTLAYTHALFETANYGQHVVMCDHLLELVIMHNIDSWGGEDIYAQLLLKKAASLYHLHEFARAEHITRELIKLHPQHRLATRLLSACLLRQRPLWLTRVRAAAVLFVLLSAFAIMLELLVVRPFFIDWYSWAQVGHYTLLGIGLGALLVGESLHTVRCYREAVGFAQRRKQMNRA